MAPSEVGAEAGGVRHDFTGPVLDALQQQCGVLSRSQMLNSGMSRKQIEVRLRAGRWQRLYPGVYATFSGAPGRPAVLWAGLLRAGDRSVLSHYTVAELQGQSHPSPPFTSRCPAAAESSIPGVALHYSHGSARLVIQCGRRPRPGSRRQCWTWPLGPPASTMRWGGSSVRAAAGDHPDRCAALALRSRVRWRTELGAALGLGAGGSLLAGVPVRQPVERPMSFRPRSGSTA